MVSTRRSARLQQDTSDASAEEANAMYASPKPRRRSTGSGSAQKSTPQRKSARHSVSPARAVRSSPRTRASTRRTKSATPSKDTDSEPEVEKDENTSTREEKETLSESDQAQDAQECVEPEQEAKASSNSEVQEQAAKSPEKDEQKQDEAKNGETPEEQDAEEEEEEEEEIMMLPTDSEEDDDGADEEEAVKALGKEESSSQGQHKIEQAQGDDEDIEQYAILAATGLSLTSSREDASNQAKVSSKRNEFQLVSDALDSGASNHTRFLDLKGRKCSEGAALVASKSSDEVSSVLQSQLQAVAQSKKQRDESLQEKSAGRKWFGMASDELTADARRDFALLRMRNYLDPKKFYKSSDHTKKLPKFFQLGTVIEGAHEFKSARLTKKERQKTLTDEIMADSSIQSYTKRVFGQIQAAKSGRPRKKGKHTHFS